MKQLRLGEDLMNLHVGECVTFRDRAYFVRGMSPMGVAPRRAQLEAADTGERVEVAVDDVQRLENDSQVVPSLTRPSDETGEP
jgi:hypothetical protein